MSLPPRSDSVHITSGVPSLLGWRSAQTLSADQSRSLWRKGTFLLSTCMGVEAIQNMAMSYLRPAAGPKRLCKVMFGVFIHLIVFTAWDTVLIVATERIYGKHKTLLVVRDMQSWKCRWWKWRLLVHLPRSAAGVTNANSFRGAEEW